MRSTILSAALAALLCGSGSGAIGQESSTYVYDVHGRLVVNATAAASGNSNLSNYAYDSADNRSTHYSYPVAPRAAANSMASGELLLPGQAVVSNDGQSRLELRQSGALVITCSGIDQLAIYGPNGEAAQLIMQTAGNLVLYSYVPNALWATGGGGYPGAYLIVQDDGNVVIYLGGTPVWSSSTFC